MMNFALKNEKLCIDGFTLNMLGSVLKMMDYALTMVNFAHKPAKAGTRGKEGTV